MFVSFIIVGGFLYWLSVTAEPTEVAIVEESTDEGSGASTILSAADFLANPEGQIDAVVEVTGARVASRLGAQAFWIGPDDRPYLVKMSPALVETGPQIRVQSVVDITGTVFMMSDSVLTSWDSLGVFTNPGDRIVAEFATSFLEARAVQSMPGGGGGGEGS
jgi:hypothetical protein